MGASLAREALFASLIVMLEHCFLILAVSAVQKQRQISDKSIEYSLLKKYNRTI